MWFVSHHCLLNVIWVVTKVDGIGKPAEVCVQLVLGSTLVCTAPAPHTRHTWSICDWSWISVAVSCCSTVYMLSTRMPGTVCVEHIMMIIPPGYMHTALYCTVPHCTVLYCTVLHCVIGVVYWWCSASPPSVPLQGSLHSLHRAMPIRPSFLALYPPSLNTFTAFACASSRLWPQCHLPHSPYFTPGAKSPLPYCKYEQSTEGYCW